MQRSVEQRGVEQRGVEQRGARVEQLGVKQRGVKQRSVEQRGVEQRGLHRHTSKGPHTRCVLRFPGGGGGGEGRVLRGSHDSRGLQFARHITGTNCIRQFGTSRTRSSKQGQWIMRECMIGLRDISLLKCFLRQSRPKRLDSEQSRQAPGPEPRNNSQGSQKVAKEQQL